MRRIIRIIKEDNEEPKFFLSKYFLQIIKNGQHFLEKHHSFVNFNTNNFVVSFHVANQTLNIVQNKLQNDVFNK